MFIAFLLGVKDVSRPVGPTDILLAWVGHCPFIVQGQVHHGDRPEVLGATCMFYQFDLCLELLTYDYGQVYMYYNNNICVICDKFVISLSVYG